MPIVTPTPAQPLPTPPTTSDPSSFDARADATLLAQQVMVPQVNQLAEDTYTNALYAQDAAGASEVSALAAATRAQEAAEHQLEALNAVESAWAASGALPWVSGATYAQGDVVWSLIDFLAYRRRIAGAGTVDPSADPDNWAPINSVNKKLFVVSSGSAAASKFIWHVLAVTSTLTLPSSPLTGDWIGVQNSSGLTASVIARNGQKIMSKDEDLTVNARNVSFVLLYVSPAIGWVFAS
jgi:hypothetical protein